MTHDKMAKVIFILALAVGMFASACFGAAAYNNLITDGDMEAAGVEAYGCSTSAVISKDSGIKYSGAQSLRISNTVPYLGSHLFPKSIAVPSNALFNGYVRAPATTILNSNLVLVSMGQWATIPASGFSSYYNDWAQSSNGFLYVAGTYYGCVYRSTNNGISWTQIATQADLGGYVGASGLLVATNLDLYAAALHVYKSTNDGGTWTISADTGTVLEAHGANHFLQTSNGDIYVGTYGNAGDGDIFKTTNNGTTWTKSADGVTNLGNASTVQVLIQLSNGNILAGCNVGIYRSTDNGDTWNQIVGAPSDISDHGLLEATNGYFYAGTTAGHVYKSIDNGSSWIKVADGASDFGLEGSYRRTRLFQLSNGDIWALADNWSVALNAAIFKSSDNDSNWVEIANVDDDGVGGGGFAGALQADNGYLYTTDYSYGNYLHKTIGISVTQAGITNDNNWYAIEMVVKNGDFLILGVGSTIQNDYLNYDDLGLQTSFVENGGMEMKKEVIHSGVAQGGDTNKITLAADASVADGYYTGMIVQKTNDLPPGWNYQRRTIISYTGATKVVTVDANWGTAPTNTSGYEIFYYDYFNGAAPMWRTNGNPSATKSSDAHTGANAQQVGAGDASANYVGQTVTVEQGKYYTFGAWLKRVSGAGNVNISISGAATKSLSSTNSIYSKVSRTFIAQSTSLGIRLYADSGTVGLIDDVSLVGAPPMGGTVLSVR